MDLANQKAIKLNALEEAKAFFEEAMQILRTLPENDRNQHFRISLIVNQWLVYALLFKLPEYYNLMLQYKPIVVKLSIDVMREIKAKNELALAYAGLGRLYKQLGNKNYARKYLKRALAIFEQLGTLLEPEKIREDLVGLHET